MVYYRTYVYQNFSNQTDPKNRYFHYGYLVAEQPVNIRNMRPYEYVQYPVDLTYFSHSVL
jgi:hypothetical protein